MVDLHTHFLPNIDDGCQSLLEARECLLMEVKNGIKTVVLTPHFSLDQDKEVIYKAFEEFKENVKDININLVLGSEIMYGPNFIKLLKEDKAISINNSNYILLEFPFYENLYDVVDAINDILILGYKVIFAHPERYEYISMEEFKELKEIGVLFQVNTSSLNGDYGRKIHKVAKKFYSLGWIDFVSSDAHSSTGTRIPNLNKKYLKFVKNKVLIDF